MNIYLNPRLLNNYPMSSIASVITKTKASDLLSCFTQKQLGFGKGHNQLKKID